MQRLFSMFPTGRPGIALLLMRAGLSAMLLDGILRMTQFDGSIAVHALVWLSATLLFAGLLTPLAAALCVLIEMAAWIAYGGLPEVEHVCALLSAIALALLGPGGYSVDARVFGRRKVIFSNSGSADSE